MTRTLFPPWIQTLFGFLLNLSALLMLMTKEGDRALSIGIDTGKCFFTYYPYVFTPCFLLAQIPPNWFFSPSVSDNKLESKISMFYLWSCSQK